ncbi:MAG: carbohydrate ABC transporter permease [Alicyclobacillus sp.]|nr:carbohydrate ABC transporter permease [Alicyclobacillus sp.]
MVRTQTSTSVRGVPLKQHRKLRSRAARGVIFVVLVLGSVVILSPMAWMLSTSLKSMEDIIQNGPSLIPSSVHWDNFVKAWQAAPFTRYTLNTLMIAFFTVVGSVLSNSFISYGFAKIRFPGRDFLFMLLLGTMMIPGFTTMIPQYVLFSKLHWVGTYLPLIVPPFFGSAFFTFMMRQFSRTIPDELIEAAKIDGMGHFGIWLRIMVPLTRPALLTIAIFAFNGAWNEYVGPLLYLNQDIQYTIQVGLTTFQGQVQTQWNYLMAASILVILPVVVLFFLFQKYFIEGSNIMGGIKG